MTILIVNGGVNMPAFGGLPKSEELANLLAFLAPRSRTKAKNE
jgi:hypothetical protein